MLLLERRILLRSAFFPRAPLQVVLQMIREGDSKTVVYLIFI